MTRWAQPDLTGKLIAAQSEPKADQWSIIKFPAIMPSGKPVWPEYWSLEDLEKTKASISQRNWNAQYMQDPTAEEGAIIKREWWRPWTGQGVPNLLHVIQSYDTAFSAKESGGLFCYYHVGIFQPVDGEMYNIILLDAVKGRWEFPDLKEEGSSSI
jgi:hypothetical protein